jgi:PAS domain S-box-containing protein
MKSFAGPTAGNKASDNNGRRATAGVVKTNVPQTAGVPHHCPCSDHFVQFYEHDDFLISALGQFIVDGLTGEANTLVIATPAHQAALDAHLDSLGIDVAAQRENGRYMTLDATETLSTFMVGGVPDAALFQRHVGELVARQSAGGRRLCAFGEMVALLWADGKPDAALQLEELWNDLGTRHAFSLFCAYPMSGFSNHTNGRPFLHVCKAHTRVLPAESYSGSQLSTDDRLRTIAVLQQKAAALETEVTERRRVEQALRRRDAELTAFVENATIGLHWVGTDGTILWANRAELELLGYSYDEYIGRHISEFHADAPVIANMLARLSRNEKLRNFEARLRRKDGTIRTVVIDSTVFWDDGRFVHTQCFTRDVTDQLRAEQASRHLAAIVQSSDDAIISKDLNGVITSWNEAAQRIFGYTPEEAIGRSILLLIPQDRLDEERQLIGRIRRGERVEHFETLRRCKDGRLLDISLSISPIKDGHGRIVGASKIARDITDRKKAERALKNAHEELARTNEDLERRVLQRTASLHEAIAQMEEFSYTVSHDLRAPLRGMQVYSQVLLEDHAGSLDDEAKHCIMRIAENATRLDRMVLDVLTFSRISRADLKMQPVALDKLVRDLVQHYPGMQAPHASIQIEPLAPVLGHEPSLTQTISNLLSNAVKFVAPGVTPQVRVWTERCEGGVRLWVQDNGIGIKPEHQDRLFRMFERVHPNLPYDGTGVGLAIVRKAVNRMGGTAGMESDGRQGSRFWVQLPAAEVAA